jgi:hypothetical protein
MVNFKSQKLVVIILVILGLTTSAFALWPQGREARQEQTALTRAVRPESLSPWKEQWPDSHLARILSQIPLHGSLLDFYTMEAVDQGLVGVALLLLPDHPVPAKVWKGCLLDAEALVARSFALIDNLQGLYVVAGLEPCSDGCSAHFYDMWGIYVTREIAHRDGPRGWRLLGAAEDIWWEESYFAAGEEGK